MSFLSQPVTFFSTAKRYIDDIELQVVISENTNDTLTITKQPVQQGASISDHAYKEPTTLSMTIYFRDNPLQSLSAIYQEFLDLQEAREPFSVVTPKRVYDNMMLAVIINNTDKSTENCISLTLTLQEVIIVSVTTASVPRTRQSKAQSTTATSNKGKRSALFSLKQGIGALSGGQ